MGYTLTSEELDRVTRDFKALAERKKEILDEDLLALLHHGAMEDAPDVHRLVALDVQCGGTASTARVVLESGGDATREAVGTGDGPIDAAFAALATLTDVNIVLQNLSIRSSTPGEDALGEVSIQARADGHTFAGRGASTDVVRASVDAYVHLMNKVEQARVMEARHLERTANAWAV
jgi:2-isopropylmalate synthase